MKIGVYAVFTTPVATAETLKRVSSQLENAGMDSLWMGEHVALFEKMEFPYPDSLDGKVPIPAGSGFPDTVATFGFLASVTSRIRLGAGISLIAQRNPIYTAKEFATLDWLSSGRIDFGIGLGWCKEEVVACGYEFENRGERCDEVIEMMVKLWTENEVTYLGKHYQIHACRMDPKPIQSPHIPILVGGHSKAALRRAARYANGWFGFNLNPKLTRSILIDLDEALTAVGRSRDGFEIIIMPSRLNNERILEFKDIGVDRLIPTFNYEHPKTSAQQLSELESYAVVAD